MIKKGCVVRWVRGSKLTENDKDCVGLVLTNPKEQSIQISPKFTAIKMVVDVSFGNTIFKVLVENLEKVKW